MLIPLHQLVNHFKLNLRGVLHVGAHECEEQNSYLQHNIDNNNIYWIEAMEDKVKLMKERNKNVFTEMIIASPNTRRINLEILS